MTVKKAIEDIIYVAFGAFFILVLLYVTAAIASPIIDIETIVSLIIFALAVAFHEPLIELLNVPISI